MASDIVTPAPVTCARPGSSPSVHVAGLAAVVEDRFAVELHLDLVLETHDHAHEHVVGVVVGGGRVCGVVRSTPWRGPIVSASLTSTQPVGVFQVVASTFVPGS